MTDPLTTTYRGDLRSDEGTGRFYHWGDEAFISVTNAIKKGFPAPALMYWSAKMVAEYVAENPEEVEAMRQAMEPAEFTSFLKNKPWVARDKAGDLGSQVHDIAEQYQATGTVPPLESFPEVVQAKAALYLDFLETVKPTFYAIEGVVFNRQYGYAGAFDAIMDIDYGAIKGRYIVDIKTGSGIYAEAALQQTAYRHGEYIAVGDQEIPMPEVGGAFCLHIQATQWKLVPVVTDEASWVTFRAALHVARWVADGSDKAAVGKPVAIGRR